MKTVWHIGSTVFALAVVAGCGEASHRSGGATWVAERDTMGDTVIIRTMSGSAGAADYTLERELTIGMLEGPEEYVFGDVRILAVGPEGDIYAYDSQVPVLRKYDREGRFLTTIGGEGGGPGEYQQATGVAIAPDGTVKVWDPRAPRLSSFSPDGEFLHGQRVESRGSYSSRSLFVDTLGNTYVWASFRGPDETIFDDYKRGLLKVDGEGQVVDTLFEPDMDYEEQRLELTVTSGTSVGRTVMSVPFAPSVAWAFSPHGYYVAGVGDRYAVSLLRSGEPVLRIERVVDPVPVDPDEKEAWRQAITANMRRMSPDWRWDGPPIPDTKAVFRQLSVGLDGRVWVWRYQRAEPREMRAEDQEDGPNPRRDFPEPTVYDVFEPDGRYLGAVHVPPRTTIRVMRGDHVWGVSRDSLDVQYIDRFRLVGSEG